MHVHSCIAFVVVELPPRRARFFLGNGCVRSNRFSDSGRAKARTTNLNTISVHGGAPKGHVVFLGNRDSESLLESSASPGVASGALSTRPPERVRRSTPGVEENSRSDPPPSFPFMVAPRRGMWSTPPNAGRRSDARHFLQCLASSHGGEIAAISISCSLW